MRGVADAEQARKMPFPQPVDLHREQFDPIPAFEFVHAMSEVRRNAPNGLAKRIDPVALGLLERTLRDNQASLKIVATVDQDQRPAIVDIPQQLLGIARSTRNAKPKHIDRHTELLHLKTHGSPHRRMPPVASHDKVRLDVYRSLRRSRLHSGDSVAHTNQVGALALHPELKARESLRAIGKKLQEIPLLS